MTFTREQLEAARSRTVPDLLGPDLKLLFVGINPGLWTAASGAHFGHPGNRFYKALAVGGIVDEALDVRAGFDDRTRSALVDRGIGITNIVMRTTARADELAKEELRAGALALKAKVEELRPTVVAFVGLGAYRTGFAKPKAKVGKQETTLGGASVWALPNPSGLNAHYQVADLARLYREAAIDAGVVAP
ncbi:MAG: TDG/mug DNA glycosylase family protein [Myxococcota bacterium]|jgi:TDG/mug DNA glycosylase family protein